MKKLIVILAMLIPQPAFAQDAPPITVAVWKAGETGLELTITLSELLTKKQRQMIEGGFTTFSDLTIYSVLANGNPQREQAATQLRCSVKYDAWEEVFDVAQLTSAPRASIVKQFPAYAGMCLQATMTKSDMEQRNIQIGADIIAELSVIQTSLDEEQKIKEWLVSQQSGVMQTLFSHMLGELSLHQRLVVRISIPPVPESIGKLDQTEGKEKG